MKRTQSSQQMFGARDLAASSAEFRLVSQLSFGFGAGGDGADDLDDLDVPVTEPSEEEALDFFTEEIDQELDGAPHEAPSLPTADARAAPRLTLGAARRRRIGPWGRPAGGCLADSWMDQAQGPRGQGSQT